MEYSNGSRRNFRDFSKGFREILWGLHGCFKTFQGRFRKLRCVQGFEENLKGFQLISEAFQEDSDDFQMHSRRPKGVSGGLLRCFRRSHGSFRGLLTAFEGVLGGFIPYLGRFKEFPTTFQGISGDLNRTEGVSSFKGVSVGARGFRSMQEFSGALKPLMIITLLIKRITCVQ